MYFVDSVIYVLELEQRTQHANLTHTILLLSNFQHIHLHAHAWISILRSRILYMYICICMNMLYVV